MKRVVFIVLSTLCVCCSGLIGKQSGSIYGVVTDSSSAEPMRAAGVSLYENHDDEWYLLSQTVTYDDGHFEFNDLIPGYYQLSVLVDGYETCNYKIIVESGRTARADLRMSKVETGLTVITEKYNKNGDKDYTFYGTYLRSFYNAREWGFVVDIDSDPTVMKGAVIKSSTTSWIGSDYRQSFTANATGNNYKGYHFRAYAIDKEYGIVVYGEDKVIND